MKKIFRAVIFLLILAAPLSAGAQTIAPPGGTPNIINSVDAFTWVLEENDLLVVARYTITYPPTAYPTLNIGETFIARIASAGVTIGDISPYPDAFFNGYKQGVLGFYFTPTQASSTWNGNITVSLIGNPTLTWSGSGAPNFTQPLITGASGWHNSTTQTNTQNLIASTIRSIASYIQSNWGITLLSGIPSRFNADGVSYFSGAIPNLQTMAPGVFPATIIIPSVRTKTFSTSYSDTLANQWVSVPYIGPILYMPIFGLSATLWKAIAWFALMFYLAWLAHYYLAQKGMEKGAWFVTFPQMFIGTLLGFVPLSFGGLIAALAYIGLSRILWWRDG